MTLRTHWPTCAICQAIPLAIFRSGAENKPHQLWSTFSAFAGSASRGCHTCTLLYESVQEQFKQQLDVQPVYLERARTGDSSAQAVALTVDLTSLADNESLLQIHDAQSLCFEFAPVADVKYTLCEKDVPQNARHFKGELVSFNQNSGC